MAKITMGELKTFIEDCIKTCKKGEVSDECTNVSKTFFETKRFAFETVLSKLSEVDEGEYQSTTNRLADEMMEHIENLPQPNLESDYDKSYQWRKTALKILERDRKSVV